jgi:hypothetical protein
MASHGCAIVETPRGCAKELTVVLCDRLRVPNIALGGPPLRTRITSVLRWSLRKPGFRDRRTTQPPQSTRPHRAPAPPRARAALPPPPALATAPFANTAQLLHPSLAPVKPFFSPSPRALIPDTSRPLPRAPPSRPLPCASRRVPPTTTPPCTSARPCLRIGIRRHPHGDGQWDPGRDDRWDPARSPGRRSSARGQTCRG